MVTDVDCRIRGQVFIKNSIITVPPVMIHGANDDLSDGGVHINGSILDGNIDIQGDSVFVTDTTIINRRRQVAQFGGFIVMKLCRFSGDCYLMSYKEPFIMKGIAGQVVIPEMVTSTLDKFVQWNGSWDRKPDFESVISDGNSDFNELLKLNWR